MEYLSLIPLGWLLLIPVLVLGFRYSLVEGEFWKRFGSFVCRVIGVVLLILTLCRPFSNLANRNLHVAILLDVSESIELRDALRAVDDMASMIDSLNPEDSFSLHIVADGMRPLDDVTQLRELLQNWIEVAADTEFRSHSRLPEALLEARLAFPAEKAKRIVLFSDGQNTSGQWSRVFKQLQDERVDVFFNRIQSLQKKEVAVERIQPSTKIAFQNEVVRMSVVLLANHAAQGKLRITHRGVVVQERDFALSSDKQETFYFDVDMVTPGTSQWKAEIIPDDDHFLVNNQVACQVTVRGKPRILILHQQESELRSFTRALAKQEFDVEVRGKLGVPETITEMTEFDAILIADLPATQISPRQMELLNRYVKEFGGGLAMLGSENSFGLGGYHKTPVEEVLPLVSRFEKEKEKPSLAMVLVLDKSGSMEGLPIALARQAAKSAAELLSGRDQIAVIGFDSEALIACEMTRADSVNKIHNAIDSLAAGGGTNMFPAMVLAKQMLEDTPAKIKHMICLGDGLTEAADFESLTQLLTSSGITVSTVALGEADRDLMARIADIGRGRYYETDNPLNVPQIFAKETMQASKSAIKEDVFGSVQTADHPVLSGFEGVDLPFTFGYVMTQAKPTAQVLLVAETGDPLLAISRYGLGTGMAYTSDMSEKWGGEWLAWSDCGKYWGQILRGMTRKNQGDGISLTSSVSGEQFQLAVKQKDSTGLPISGTPWECLKFDETGGTTEVMLDESGLGVYQAEFPVGKSDFTLQVKDLANNQFKMMHYSVPYPGEYRLSDQISEEIQSLPAIEAGQIREGLIQGRSRQSVAHYFYMLALVFFLAGILLRRI